ncbi:hypothetical protein A7A08_00808 [Methyloligella halotolerans]|uniref:Small integral membrane protein n=1 Tax=Methyloligella halotolerans TaxID=1177755 RepID=A0A1E2S391_9HYPH|nr:DUF2165 domain-containing protein [Methyloligella halotolerans]ODA68973.1 hypothetical protein A7A08_00808 [Methyloligella halotolerans]
MDCRDKPGNDNIRTMLVARLAKIVMVLCLAAFCAIVAYDNVADYEANYGFVGHVLSMEDTFQNNPLRDRAIRDEGVWRAAYAGIIAAEAVTGLLFLIGAVQMSLALRKPASEFQRAKAFVVAGATLGFLLWFFGFMVVGGEFFAMWQSKDWNGQEAAFRFYATMLLVLIFVYGRDEAS